MTQRIKILLGAFCLVFPLFCHAEALLFWRDADEVSQHLRFEGGRYVITDHHFTGKTITHTGTYVDSKDAIVFQDKEPGDNPSIVHGQRFLKKKDGETLYLVRESSEKEFDETIKSPHDDYLRSDTLGGYFVQVERLPSGWGIYAFLKDYAAKHSKNALDYFYVSAVKKEQEQEFVYAYWMTGNSILIINLPDLRKVDLSQIVPMLTKRIRLDADVVPAQKDIKENPALVTLEWARERIKECLASEDYYIVGKEK